jgi:hypothetical protein
VIDEVRVQALERQVAELRRRQQEQDEFIDTITSPLWKRLIWWVLGYYFRKVGRWYRPGWTPSWPK